MRAPIDVSSGQGIYKLMARRPRLPKAWEDDFEECQAFVAWADAVPASTARSLLPMIWPLRARLQYQDSGGLNGFLKDFGLTKRAWKAINALTVEETAEAYAYFRERGESSWPARFVAPAETLREAAVEPSLALMFVLAEAEISLEGISAPYDADWKMLVRALSVEVAEKRIGECAELIGQAILARDYLQGGDADIGPGTGWADICGLAQRWAETAAAAEVDIGVASAVTGEAVQTPGGGDEFADPASGFIVKRLIEFPEFARESELMDHCIGRSRHYFDKHMAGRGAFYSFRLPGRERPVATLELGVFDGDWRICQCRGPSNRPPGEEADALAERLRQAHQFGHSVERSAEIEVLDEVGRGLPSMLTGTSSRYF